MSVKSARARVEDVHELAMAMPSARVEPGSRGNPVYQVGGRSFVFFRNPRADATDPTTGERYVDVIVFWVSSESDKQAMVQDPASPFFTTAHFHGHPSVLLRSGRIGELTHGELAEVVRDAWLAQASERRRTTWLAAHAGPVADRESSIETGDAGRVTERSSAESLSARGRPGRDRAGRS